MSKLRDMDSPIDRVDKSIYKIVLEPGKKTKVVKYNWIQRLIRKLFKL